MFRRSIAAHGNRSVQSRDRGNLNDVSRVLATHRGQRGLRHGDSAEEIGLELSPQFVELDVFGKPGYGESRIVDENVQPSVVAYDGLDEALDGLEPGDVESANVDARGHSRRGDCLIQTLAPPHIAHGGHYAESGFRQFDRGQQSEAARCAGNQSYFFRHGNGVTQSCTKKRSPGRELVTE